MAFPNERRGMGSTLRPLKGLLVAKRLPADPPIDPFQRPFTLWRSLGGGAPWSGKKASRRLPISCWAGHRPPERRVSSALSKALPSIQKGGMKEATLPPTASAALAPARLVPEGAAVVEVQGPHRLAAPTDPAASRQWDPRQPKRIDTCRLIPTTMDRGGDRGRCGRR